MYYYTTIDGLLAKSTEQINSSIYLPITEERYYELLAQMVEEAE